MRLSAFNHNPSVVLTFNGGFVDTAGFILLHGLFVAHVTGNFVTAGATFLRGTPSAHAELLALPVFCLTVFGARIASLLLKQAGGTTLRILLGAQVALLALGGAMAITFGPFPSGGGAAALRTGMTLVAAMAVQNAAHRSHLAEAPPSTLVTGSITQVIKDLTDVALIRTNQPALRSRIQRLEISVVVFALGCATSAVLCACVGTWSLVLPPVLAVLGAQQVCAGEPSLETRR